MIRTIQRVFERVSRAIMQPRSELNRFQRSVRYLYELARYGAQQLREDRATQMAAALTFRTLFALLPVILVATILVRAVAGEDKVKEWVSLAVQGVGIADVRLQLNEGASRDPAIGSSELENSNLAESQGAMGDEEVDPPEKTDQGQEDESQPPQNVEEKSSPLASESGTLGDFFRELVEAAAKLDLNTLGLVGFLVVLYSAISLMVTIEESFNAIFRAPSGRSWVRRVPLYWTVLTLSPVLIGGMVYLNQMMVTWGAFVDAQIWLTIVQVSSSLFTTWLLFTAVYLFVPSTRVSIRAALTGALIASILFEVLKRSLSVYFEYAFSLSRLYSSLGLIPLMMFWLYLMWLVFLFGVEVASAVQRLGRRLEEREKADHTGLVDTSNIVDLVCRIGQSFMRGEAASVDDLTEDTGLNKISTSTIIDALVKTGLVHRVADNEEGVCLAKPPGSMPISEVLRAAYRIIDGGKSVPKLTATLRERQLEASGDMTLKSWLNPMTAAGTGATNS